MNTQRQHGFTLWELLVTLMVAGILFGIGVPNVLEFLRNGAMTGAVNNLITSILVARTESVKQQAPVGWCLTNDPLAATPTCIADGLVSNTASGFVVWVDENGNLDANGARILTDANDGNLAIDGGEQILTRGTAPGGSILLSTNCGRVAFAPTGFTRRVGAQCFPGFRAILFCDDRGRRVAAGSLSSARVVLIDRVGHAQVLTEKPAVDLYINPLGATCP